MPKAAVDHHPPAAAADPSDSNSEPLEDDEDEYEEVEEEFEIEEEVEIEEKVEEGVEDDEKDTEDDKDTDEDEKETEEDDDEEEEFGEDLSPINGDHREDVAHNVETEEHEEKLNSSLFARDKYVKVSSIDIYAVKGTRDPDISDQMVMSEEEEYHVNNMNPNSSDLGKDANSLDDLKFKESVSFKNESRSLPEKITPTGHEDAHYNIEASLGNEKLNVLTTAPISNYSHAAISVRENFGQETTGLRYSEEKNNKRLCLHSEDIKHKEARLKDHPARPRSVSPDAEFRDGNKRPAMICEFFAKGWCIKGKTCRFLHTRDVTSQHRAGAEADANQETAQQTNEGLGCCAKRVTSQNVGQSSSWSETQESNLYKDNTASVASFKTDGRENLRGTCYSHNNGKYASEEMIGTRSQFLVDAYSTHYDHSLNTSLRTTLPTATGTFTRSSLSFGSTTWDLDPLGSQRCLDGERGYGASRSGNLQHSCSPFSVSESENPSWKVFSGDFQCSAGYRTENSSYNWEPSAPFRPSFSITQRLLSSVKQYDPLRDSIESPKPKGILSKFPNSNRELFGSGYNNGKQSPAKYQNIHDNFSNKKIYGKDLLSAETETVVSAIAEPQNRKEEKKLGAAHQREITKMDTSNADHGCLLQTSWQRQKTKSKIDTAGQISFETDPKIDEDMIKESKAQKLFRVALIDFVKEFVKPSWHEGNLSKDAHKVIVKRSVGKVLSTIPTHQIPSTPESVQLYLSSSQPKIAKLVEGYIEKYGKP